MFSVRSKTLDTGHALRFNAPDLEPETAQNVLGMQRRGLGTAQFRDIEVNFRQPIEGDAVVEVMDMVIADVGGEPRHEGAGFQEAGGFERRFFVSPASLVAKAHAGKVVLGVKEIGAERAGDQARQNQGQNRRPPTEKHHQRHIHRAMQEERQQAIVMFARRAAKGKDHHGDEENGDVTEEDVQRMTHEQVSDTLAAGGFSILLPGHDRKRADLGAAQPGIVGVMMVVRGAPDAAGTQDPDAVEAHEKFRDWGIGQDGMVLLIVVNHEKPDHEQARKHAANDAHGDGHAGKSSRTGCHQKKCGGKDAPPTDPEGIPRVRLGSREQRFTSTH
jgi:hypothetical protein